MVARTPRKRMYRTMQGRMIDIEKLRGANEEIKAVGRSKPKMEKLMQKYKLKDTLARDAITGKEAGSFNIDTLEKFMENSVGIGLGKGSFAAARRPFAFRCLHKS